jgi:predicted metal-dependent hydrolase
MVLWARPGVNDEAKRAIVARWYREQIKAVVPGIIAKWEPLVGVKLKRIFVQEMKTKWGSCNQRESSIRLNTDLAKKPRECLEWSTRWSMYWNRPTTRVSLR